MLIRNQNPTSPSVSFCPPSKQTNNTSTANTTTNRINIILCTSQHPVTELPEWNTCHKVFLLSEHPLSQHTHAQHTRARARERHTPSVSTQSFRHLDDALPCVQCQVLNWWKIKIRLPGTHTHTHMGHCQSVLRAWKFAASWSEPEPPNETGRFMWLH